MGSDRDNRETLGFVNTRAAQQLAGRLAQPGATLVVGGRGMGKTTLLYNAAQQNRGHRPVLVVAGVGPQSLDSEITKVISNPNRLRTALVIADDADRASPTRLADLITTVIASAGHTVFAAHRNILQEIILAAPKLEDRIALIQVDEWDISQLIQVLNQHFREGIRGEDLATFFHEMRSHSPRDAVAAAERAFGGASQAGMPVIKAIEQNEAMEFSIDPGDASAADLARVYSALSDLYRAFGGDGLVFREGGSTVLTTESTR
jgi:hypothetical protein